MMPKTKFKAKLDQWDIRRIDAEIKNKGLRNYIETLITKDMVVSDDRKLPNGQTYINTLGYPYGALIATFNYIFETYYGGQYKNDKLLSQWEIEDYIDRISAQDEANKQYEVEHPPIINYIKQKSKKTSKKSTKTPKEKVIKDNKVNEVSSLYKLGKIKLKLNS